MAVIVKGVKGVLGWRQGWGMNNLKYDEHWGGNFSYMDTTRHRAVKLRSPSKVRTTQRQCGLCRPVAAGRLLRRAVFSPGVFRRCRFDMLAVLWVSARGWVSSVGIATRYGLDGLGIDSRWGRARFSTPAQTGPGAHPASCTTGTGSVSRV